MAFPPAAPVRIGIFYFSGTGNTDYIVKVMKEILGTASRVESFPIETLPDVLDTALFAPYDLLVFGAPIYAFNIPKLFARFLNRLPPGNGKRTFFFLNAGDAAWVSYGHPLKLLRRRGYDVIGWTGFTTPGNFGVVANDAASGEVTFLFFGYRLTQNAPAVLAECRSAVETVARQLSAGEKLESRTGFWPRAMSLAFRPVFYWLACPRWSMTFRSSPACNQCGLCVRACPTRNIRLARRGVSFGSACTACFRCVNICPELAIRFRWPFSLLLGATAQYRAPGWHPPQRTPRDPSLG